VVEKRPVGTGVRSRPGRTYGVFHSSHRAEKPFAGQEELLSRVYPFPWLYLQEPLLSFQDLALNASLMHAAKMFGNQCFQVVSPAPQMQVQSRHHFVDAGNNQQVPQNLGPLFSSVLGSLRDAAVTKYLISRAEEFDRLNEEYLLASGLLLENSFDKMPAAHIDVVIPADVFVRLSCLYGDRLGLLFYVQLTGSPLYQRVHALVKEAATVKIDFKNAKDVAFQSARLAEHALRIVRCIDDSIIRNDANKSYLHQTVGGASQGINNIPVGRRLRNSPFLMNFSGEFSSETISIHEREVNGMRFLVEYKTALSLPNRYLQLSGKVKPYQAQMTAEILRIKNQNWRLRQKPTQYSGQLQVRNYWRTRSGDPRIFTSQELFIQLKSEFNAFFLIDNSCSISPVKIAAMETSITLCLDIIRDHPDVFPFLAAYRQNGGSKKVHLTKLFAGETARMTPAQLGRILYFKSELVNYDAYALYEMLTSHQPEVENRKRTSIVFLFGDSWPVSLNKDTRAEAVEIMETIRSTWPNLVIVYFATSKMIDMNALGYDHYIDLKAEEFSLQSLLEQFKKVMEQVLSAR
jgi:hypothetical protein